MSAGDTHAARSCLNRPKSLHDPKASDYHSLVGLYLDIGDVPGAIATLKLLPTSQYYGWACKDILAAQIKAGDLPGPKPRRHWLRSNVDLPDQSVAWQRIRSSRRHPRRRHYFDLAHATLGRSRISMSVRCSAVARQTRLRAAMPMAWHNGSSS